MAAKDAIETKNRNVSIFFVTVFHHCLNTFPTSLSQNPKHRLPHFFKTLNTNKLKTKITQNAKSYTFQMCQTHTSYE